MQTRHKKLFLFSLLTPVIIFFLLKYAGDDNNSSTSSTDKRFSRLPAKSKQESIATKPIYSTLSNSQNKALPAPSTINTKASSAVNKSSLLQTAVLAQKKQFLKNPNPNEFQIAHENYALSLTELYVKSKNGNRYILKIDAQKDINALQSTAANLIKDDIQSADLVLYETEKEPSKYTRRIISNQLVLKLSPSVSPKAMASILGATYEGEISYAQGYHRYEMPDSASNLTASSRLSEQRGILAVLPQIGRYQEKSSVPNDTYYPKQWHLSNNGQSGGTAGIDINVAPVWNNYKGSGILIGIVDDGVQASHPDLAQNINNTLDYDFIDHDGDSAPNVVIPNFQDPLNDPTEDSHGTAVAGIAAGRGFNGIGISGVAPEAGIVGIRLIGGYSTDLDKADAMNLHHDVIGVKNNSWGFRDDGFTLAGPQELTKLAFENAITSGRSGRGTIFVWAAGNGGLESDNSNKDGYSNSIYTISVSSIDHHGKRASYSEAGTNILICAPGGDSGGRTATTDLITNDGYNYTHAGSEFPDNNYTRNFSGTSAAAPMVSGVVALMLNANPTLNWRDIQEILIRTAVKNDPSHEAWITNGAGNHFNPHYGAGLVDTNAAVNMAMTWSNLADRRSSAKLPSESLALDIPDNDDNGLALNFDFTGANLKIEHVELEVFIAHPFRGEITCSLTSPSNTESLLAWKHKDDGSGYYEWKFSSVHHWGENASGIWTVLIKDLESDNLGEITQATLTLHGVEQSTPNIPKTPSNLVIDALNTSMLKLNWNDNSNIETNHVVEISFGYGSPWIVWDVLPANSTSYIEYDIPQGIELSYRVKAINGLQESAYSNFGTASVQHGSDALIYATGFEPTDGYSAGQAIAGQDGWQQWTGFSYPGNSIVSNIFNNYGLSNYGQQARVGFQMTTSNKTFPSVFRWIAHTPEPGTLISFKTKLLLLPSTNGQYDYFGFQIANSDGDYLADILFSDYDNSIFYTYAGANNYIDSGVNFNQTQIYDFEIILDYNSNSWSAQLNGSNITSNIPLSTNNMLLDLGGINAYWLIYDTNTPSNGSMVFDAISFRQLAKQTPFGVQNLSAEASSSSAMLIIWDQDPLAETYHIERSNNGINGWVEIAIVDAGENYFFDPELAIKTHYYYRVRTKNALGFSAYSTITSATTYDEFQDWKDSYRYDITDNYTLDNDNDGIPLLMEYALSLHPNRPSTYGLPQTYTSNNKLKFVYYRARSDVRYRVLFSTDLIYWSDTGVIQEERIDGRYVTASVDIPSSGGIFLKLEVAHD